MYGSKIKVVGQAARIGEVAHATGLSIDTIRFYEKQGLLKRSPRTEGGFRLFGADKNFFHVENFV
jgi:hypothetical protein